MGRSDPNLVARAGASGGWNAWLLCAERRVADELGALLAVHARGIQLRLIEELPPDGTGGPPGAGICFLDITSDPRRIQTLLPRLAAPPLEVPTVALLSAATEGLALQCLRKGACGCMVQPLDAGQLMPVLLRAGWPGQEAQLGARRRTICVMPARGSSGATTLAVNLACQAGRGTAGGVLLADMDPFAGTVAFMLKLKSNYSCSDALAHSANLDEDLWRGLVTRLGKLDVLLAPDNPLEATPDAGGAPALLAYARRAYGLVLLDTGSPFDALGLEAARLADEVLLVTTTEVGVVHGAKRTVEHLRRNGLPLSRSKILLGRWRRDAGFSPKEVEAVLEQEIYHALPNDPQAVHEALIEGRPVNPGSTFGKSLAALAERLLDHEIPEEKAAPPPRWRSLLSPRR